MKKIIWLLIGVSLLFISLGARSDVTEPDVLVKNIAQEVLSVVKQDKGTVTGGNKKLLALVDAKVLPHFDFERMTQGAVGKNWRNATPEQRKKLVVEFRNLLVHTYTNSFTRYTDQTVEVKPLQAQAGAKEVNVMTLIVKPGTQPIAVNYDMEKTANGWKAFDLTVEGASLVTTYRSSFEDQVKQTGIDGLIKSLADKNASNNAAHKD